MNKSKILDAPDNFYGISEQMDHDFFVIVTREKDSIHVIVTREKDSIHVIVTSILEYFV